MLQATLRIRDRRAYAVHESSMENEPTLVRLWWPLNVQHERVEDGSPVIFTTRNTVLLDRAGAPSFHDRLEIGFDGSVQAEIIEREEIPPPKTRCEVRYRQGRWQRCLKSRGWV